MFAHGDVKPLKSFRLCNSMHHLSCKKAFFLSLFFLVTDTAASLCCGFIRAVKPNCCLFSDLYEMNNSKSEQHRSVYLGENNKKNIYIPFINGNAAYVCLCGGFNVEWEPMWLLCAKYNTYVVLFRCGIVIFQVQPRAESSGR